MRITKLGHACLLVEEGGARVLLDPGAFTAGWEDVRDLSAVLVTHAHPDHLDPDRIGALLAANPGAPLLVDPGSGEQLAAAGVDATVVRPGETRDLAGLAVEVVGGEHALIHADIPRIPNNGYLLGDRLLHPGDSLADPGRGVEVLALPAAAPWMRAAEAVDLMLAVRPRVVVPIHDAVLSDAGQSVHHGLLRRFAEPAGVRVEVLAGDRASLDL